MIRIRNTQFYPYLYARKKVVNKDAWGFHGHVWRTADHVAAFFKMLGKDICYERFGGAQIVEYHDDKAPTITPALDLLNALFVE